MDDQEKLQQQLADIGLRYLKRTLGELDGLRELAAASVDAGPADAGAAAALVQIAQMAHRICGSGAMFGFEDLSERAREVERLALAGGEDSRRRLAAALAALDAQVRSLARARNLE